MKDQIITDIEKASGFIARNKKSLPKKINNVDEFIDYVIPRLNNGEFVGVNYKDRVQWLEANGYEVTRAHLIDASLSTKQPE